MDVGKRLKELREQKNISQKEVAEFLNVKQNTYSQYENGQRQLPVEVCGGSGLSP